MNFSFNLFPNIDNTFYEGEEKIYPKFKYLIETLLKYYIDEKDVDFQQKFFNILGVLFKKTPQNFIYELDLAKFNQQLKRVEVIQNVIMNKHI